MKYSEKFMVKPGSSIKLDKIDAAFKDKHEDQTSALGEIETFTQRLRELQYLLYAENKRSLLIVLQAMDAGGKDGTINHVLGNMNPQGAKVYGFKVPSAEEAAHDFLWRIHKAAPQHGQVSIFNRSHYEDVLISRVHNFVPKKVWSKRYDLINNFEKNLVESGTHILKFYLHISEDEQLRRFKQRIDDPARHWKISESDYKEREYWGDYTKAFEDALSKCSTVHAPWYVIPANHKWFRNLAVSQIVVETLEALQMEFPKPTVDINKVKEKYHKAEAEGKNGKIERESHRKKGK
ncbi:MAG: polyphosphate kinase 2 family protein [Desulfuromonadaceae bacterium]|nr:polyphosphate kinase 2 family protein [Desulfuromonadaceae bacterium]